MVGVIVALGCWVNENLKFAKESEARYSNIGVAVSLSVLFYSPLFEYSPVCIFHWHDCNHHQYCSYLSPDKDKNSGK